MEGFGVGLCAGMGAGNGSGPRSARKKIKRQLNAVIESGEIPVLNKNGESMSAEMIIDLLRDKFLKVQQVAQTCLAYLLFNPSVEYAPIITTPSACHTCYRTWVRLHGPASILSMGYWPSTMWMGRQRTYFR